jgi:hypothetical protein
MTKFLLNLLQISKALMNSKIQFLIQKFLFPDFGPADPAARLASGPARPPTAPFPQAEIAWPAHPARASVASSWEIRFPLWFTPSRVGRRPLVSLTTVPRLSAPSFPPCQLTPAVNSPRRHSSRRPLHASDVVKPLPPPSSFPPLNPLQTEP